MTTKGTKPAREVLEKILGPFSFAHFMVGARVNLDLTQAAMAKKLKIAPGTLCDIEKGRQLVSPKFAVKVARVAGFSEQLALQACLQDQVRKVTKKYRVELVA